MWRENLLEKIKESKLTPKELADKCDISEKTILRIIKHPDATIYLDTLERLAIGLGCSLEDITNNTNAIISTESLATLTGVNEQLRKETSLLIAENNILKNQVSSLTARLELTETKLAYTEKLLAVYEKYNH